MITEIPTDEEFHDAGVNLLYLAWSLAMDLIRGSEEKYTGAELDDDSLEEYWQKSQTALGNAFSLIQQAMELGIKARIAAVSPFVLIAAEHGKWGDAPFSDFRTIDATDLVRVHNAITTPPLDDRFKAFFDDVRRRRNRLMHSVPKDSFDARTLVVNVLTAAESLFGDTPWPQRCLALEDESRTTLLDGGENARNNVMGEIELVLDYLQPAETKRFFGLDKKGRLYLCPECFSAANKDFTDDFPALAQLESKAPGETSLRCAACGTVSPVERRACEAKACRGNVLNDEGMCLVCQHYSTDEVA